MIKVKSINVAVINDGSKYNQLLKHNSFKNDNLPFIIVSSINQHLSISFLALITFN